MKIKGCTGNLFFVIFLLFSWRLSAQNLIVNGDFTQDTVGWKSTSLGGLIDIAPLNTYGGPGPVTDKGCQIVTFSTIRQTVPVLPNTVYALQFKASRNTRLYPASSAPPLASLIVTVKRGSLTFINTSKAYTQASTPFCFEQENYFFTTAATTDSVVIDFKLPAQYVMDNVVLDDVNLVSTVACNGLPVAGVPVSQVSSACFNSPFSIELTGFSLESGISFQWESSPSGQNLWSNASGNGSILFVQQTIATDYRCRVTCANSGQTAISGIITIGQNSSTNCYCRPLIVMGCSSNVIGDVYIPGEASSAINSINTGCSLEAYDDRTGIDSVILAQNGTYGVDMDGMGYGGVKVWIDFNNDGVFLPAEIIGDNGSLSSNSLPFNFSVSIPATAQLGFHRMRIRLASGGWLPNLDACGPALSGETHDYTVNIVPPASCPAPTSPEAPAAMITTNAAQLQWTQSGAVSQWQIEYGTGAFNPGTGTQLITGNNPFSLNGLVPNTSYKFYVRAICAPGDTSIWSTPSTFTTPTNCYTPIEEPATNVTSNSAELHWGQPGSAIQWEIEYAQQYMGFTLGTGTRIPVSSNPYTLTGLSQGTLYSYYIRAICGPGDTSSWSDIYSAIPFTTPVTCVAPYISGASVTTGITATSADLHWTQSGLATQWQISYGMGSFSAANGTLVMAGTNPFTVTGLNPGTVYKFYVRGICGPGDTSAWSNQSVSFTTQCIASIPPYTQDFEAPAGSGLFPVCMYAHYIPLHWSWAFSVPGYFYLKPHTGSRYFSFLSGHMDTLYTPGFDLIAGNTYYFNCYYITSGLSGWTDLSLTVGTTQNPSGYEATLVTLNNPMDTTYQPLGGAFVPPANGTYYFAIACASNSGIGNLSVDDVTVGTTPLAIRLGDITAANIKDRNLIHWTTLTESFGDRFILERSTDGKYFSALGSLEASGYSRTYEFWDDTPLGGANHYRLKLEDAGGRNSYSKTVTAYLNEKTDNELMVTPNPTSGKITLSARFLLPGATIVISDIYGRKLMTIPFDARVINIDISGLAPGEYFIGCPEMRTGIVRVTRL